MIVNNYKFNMKLMKLLKLAILKKRKMKMKVTV